MMHVALLRGINVGGHNKVAMSDLRNMLADLGFTSVKSLLQSGNLVFQSDRLDVSADDRLPGRHRSFQADRSVDRIEARHPGHCSQLEHRPQAGGHAWCEILGDIIMKDRPPETIDEYSALFSPDVQTILEKIRSTVRAEAPEAKEMISYRMPAFTLNGVLIYFAAFKQHIGVYPPVKGDAKLMKDLAPYAGEKGNLKFPLDEPIPYGLIRRIVKARLKEQQAKVAARRRKK